MLVYVLNKRGEPLMPTTPRKARVLLEERKAVVVRKTPFIIQLTITTGETKQPVTLGVDSGYKNVGISAVSGDKELFASEVKLRTDIADLLTERRHYRRTRRNRLWYRKPRFNNRTRPEGWLAPSVEHRLNEHIKAVNLVKSILQVSLIVVEAAAFDIQKIKNPDIAGVEYQNGEQGGFWNVREYVLYRDGHICQACKGNKGDKVLNVHHIITRTDGGTDKPDNLITLCETCHKLYHEGKLELKVKKFKGFKAETVMSILRRKIVNRLRELGNIVSVTYGYITKSGRIALKLAKSHTNDAYVIAGADELRERAKALTGTFTRRNNRAIQLNRKGYKPSIRKKRYSLQPNDLVKFKDFIYRVKGVHSYGKQVKLEDDSKNVVNTNISHVELICYGKGLKFT